MRALVFAAGLGIPFVVTGALLDVLMPRLKRVGKHAQAISVAGGILLIVMGFALVTGLFTELSFALNAAWFS